MPEQGGGWPEWRRYVLSGLEEARRAIEKIESRLGTAIAGEDRDELIKEHREMYRWYGVVKILGPMILGALFAMMVGIVVSFVSHLIGTR